MIMLAYMKNQQTSDQFDLLVAQQEMSGHP